MVPLLVPGLTMTKYTADCSAILGYVRENITHVSHSWVLYRHNVAWSTISVFLVLSSNKAMVSFTVSWATRSTSV